MELTDEFKDILFYLMKGNLNDTIGKLWDSQRFHQERTEKIWNDEGEFKTKEYWDERHLTNKIDKMIELLGQINEFIETFLLLREKNIL